MQSCTTLVNFILEPETRCCLFVQSLYTTELNWVAAIQFIFVVLYTFSQAVSGIRTFRLPLFTSHSQMFTAGLDVLLTEFFGDWEDEQMAIGEEMGRRRWIWHRPSYVFSRPSFLLLSSASVHFPLCLQCFSGWNVQARAETSKFFVVSIGGWTNQVWTFAVYRRGGCEVCHQLRLPKLFWGLRASYRSHRPGIQHRHCIHVFHLRQLQQGSGSDWRPSGSPARDQPEAAGSGEHVQRWRSRSRYAAYGHKIFAGLRPRPFLSSQSQSKLLHPSF